MMRGTAASALLICCLALSAQAAPPPVIKVAAKPLTLRQGGPRLTASIVITVPPAYHIQANPATPGNIPTTLLLTPPAGIKLGATIYPAGTLGTSGAASVVIYSGAVTLKTPISAAAATKPGLFKLPYRLTYQACTDVQCYAPKQISGTLTLRVVARTAHASSGTRYSSNKANEGLSSSITHASSGTRHAAR